jgi:hypothetical protein
MRHKDGSWRILVNRDITDRKRTEQQLQHNALLTLSLNVTARALACEYAQGYLFSRPVDGLAARKLLMSGHCGKKTFSAAAGK